MKKHVLLFLLAAASVPATAQNTIPNGNFESWNTYQMQQPQFFWRTSNNDLIENSIYTGFNTTQTTDAQLNSFAVRLETILVNNGQDTMFGYVTHGDPGTGEGGIPYAQRPTALTGYWKGSVAAGDTALVLVSFKLGGSVISTDVIQLYGTAASYTMFTIPINLPPVVTPDSVVVAAASSNAFVSQGIPGSYIQLDNLVFTGVSSQPAMLNGDFELWTTTNYYRPQIWNAFGDSLFRTTDNHLGNYAVQMETYAYDPQNNGITSSYLSNGTLGQSGFDGGQPYTLTTDTLCGWYKYSAGSADSAAVFVQFTNAGNVVGMYGIPLPPVASYTYFELPFLLPGTPDTALVVVVTSSDSATSADVGNTLIIDEIQFKSQPLTTHIAPVNWSNALNMQVWPNPADGIFNLSFDNKSGEPARLLITDALGRVLRDEQLNGKGLSTGQFDFSGEEKGIYLVRILQGSKTYSRKVVIR